MDDYIIKCYDVLHTQGKEYLVEDITDYVREKELMYDCISWINRNYKISGRSTFEKYLDFGRGFYITTFENQAKKWAVRKGMRQEKAAIVNVYELSEEWDDFKVLSF